MDIQTTNRINYNILARLIITNILFYFNLIFGSKYRYELHLSQVKIFELILILQLRHITILGFIA